MKNIIIEGIDCAGKTTLASKIKFKLKKMGGYDLKMLDHKDVSSQFNRYLFEYSMNDRVIFDRSHFSEAVFSKTLRNEQSISDFEFKILNDIVKAQYVTILAIPSFDDFVQRMNLSKQIQVIRIEEYNAIVDEFKNVMQDVTPIIYNSASYDELELLSDKVISFL